MAFASSHDELVRARDLGIDTCGRIAEFWGFTRTMGRMFGLLYLSAEPLPQAEIQGRLHISAGSASMTLAALGRWGVVHRIWVRGERREHYQAETDFWKMISGVLNERERREIAAAIAVVEKARTGARAAQESARGSLKVEADFVAERLERLDDICRLGQTMLDMLLGQLRLDVGRFLEVLRVAPSTPTATKSRERRDAPAAAAAATSSSRRLSAREALAAKPGRRVAVTDAVAPPPSERTSGRNFSKTRRRSLSKK